MLNNKTAIVEWLISNEPLMLEVMNNVQKRLIKTEYLFDKEIKDQYNKEVKHMIGIELGKSLGIAVEDFHEHVTDEMINKYMEVISRD